MSRITDPPRPPRTNGHTSLPRLRVTASRSTSRAATAEFDRFAERRQRIAKCGDKAVREDALALCTFDEWTDPAELASQRKCQPTLADAISKFTQFLIHRTKARAAYALQGREFVPSPESAEVIAYARKVEEVFRCALCRAFPAVPGTGAFPVRRFERVFARFLSGELRTGLISPWGGKGEDQLANDGVPDGANYFCFAEAVLVFLRLRLRTEFWRPMLRTFVGGAQVFAAAYWQPPKREWSAYKSCPTVAVPVRVILALVDHLHAGMDITRLARQFGEVAAVSLRQDSGLPQPALTAKELQ